MVITKPDGSLGFYRCVTNGAKIGLSVFEYYDTTRGEWRKLRNTDRRRELWLRLNFGG